MERTKKKQKKVRQLEKSYGNRKKGRTSGGIDRGNRTEKREKSLQTLLGGGRGENSSDRY